MAACAWPNVQGITQIESYDRNKIDHTECCALVKSRGWPIFRYYSAQTPAHRGLKWITDSFNVRNNKAHTTSNARPYLQNLFRLFMYFSNIRHLRILFRVLVVCIIDVFRGFSGSNSQMNPFMSPPKINAAPPNPEAAGEPPRDFPR